MLGEGGYSQAKTRQLHSLLTLRMSFLAPNMTELLPSIVTAKSAPMLAKLDAIVFLEKNIPPKLPGYKNPYRVEIWLLGTSDIDSGWR